MMSAYLYLFPEQDDHNIKPYVSTLTLVQLLIFTSYIIFSLLQTTANLWYNLTKLLGFLDISFTKVYKVATHICGINFFNMLQQV